MPDPKDRLPGQGLPQTGEAGGFGGTEIAAGVVAVIWVAAVLIFGWPGGEGQSFLMTLLVMLLPLGLILVAVSTLRTVRSLREEAARLQATVEAMRQAYLASQQGGAGPVTRPPAGGQAQRPDAGEAFGRVSEAANRRAGVVPQARPLAAEDQPALALMADAEDLPPPLSMSDFIKALDFPGDADDRDGFRALRLALQDHAASRLIRSAQDVLTLLSQEGIYMDDLTPEPAPPDIWRRFAAGERGKAMAALGGISDQSPLELTATRMREDLVFRDTCHHFLRTFDKTLADVAPNADDRHIATLAETRTARAFMLIGRVTGTFD